jgi:catechol 2,3-dioxygenase-like lactoylglutathione lyase family enzyme
MQKLNYLTTNIILYCKKWEETVHFYRDSLALEVMFSTDWFIEFSLNEKSRLSIADQARSSIKSSSQKGITITLQVWDINRNWNDFNAKKLEPTPVKHHAWNAKVFYVFDPEGHRIEIWQELNNS